MITKIKSIFLLILGCSLSVFTSSYRMVPASSIKEAVKKNNVAGTWKAVSAFANNHGKQMELFGSHPNGMLIFTENLHFTVVLNNPDIPKVGSPDRTKGTATDNKTAVASSLCLYGTYTTDKNGVFFLSTWWIFRNH